MKKFLALAVAMLMVLAMSTAVFATPVTTGTITVENPVNGQTYAAYKIFDLVYDGSNYAYTIQGNSPWFNVVNNYAGIDLTATANSQDNTYVVSTNANFNAAAFAAALELALNGKAATDTEPAVAPTVTTAVPAAGPTVAGDTNIVWTGLGFGYYFVTSSLGSVCSLTTTDPNAVVHDKNEGLPFDKEADDISVEIGQVVHYEINSAIPSLTGYTHYIYRVSDHMSAGLTFNNDVVITIGGVTYTPAEGEITYANNGFVLNLDLVGKGFAYDAPVVITYSATVNENAVNYNVLTNEATLEYSNNPEDYTDTETETDEWDVYTADINIIKHNSANERLADADFVLYKMVNGVKYYYVYDETNDVVSWSTNYADATHAITNANGEASFIGLEDGTYYLEEVAAPAGYNLLTEPVTVVVTANATAHVDATADVLNNTGSELPETGGIGTTIFYVIGGLMMAAAVVLLATRKKMSVED
ncbi:MAG: SpaH/EbpB family LPXTG-anchored major pilin [Clostridia bacterium]|nr:SpaH/EbpB family LPXTG-anchored major pilin [Clostridia bacterium]